MLIGMPYTYKNLIRIKINGEIVVILFLFISQVFGWPYGEYPWSSVHDLDIDIERVKLFCAEVNCSKDKPFPSVIIISNVSNYEYASQFDKRVHVKIYKRSIVFITYSWKRFCFGQPNTSLDTFPLKEIIRRYKGNASYFEYYFDEFAPILFTYDPTSKELEDGYDYKGIITYKGPARYFGHFLDYRRSILFAYDKGIGKLKDFTSGIELTICNTFDFEGRQPTNCVTEHFWEPPCTQEDVPLDRGKWQEVIEKELTLLKSKSIFRNAHIININRIASISEVGYIVRYQPTLFGGDWRVDRAILCLLHDRYYVNPESPAFFESFRGYFPGLQKIRFFLLLDLCIIIILLVLLVFFIKRWMNEQKN
jgi:hypothetical protein